MAQVVNTNFGSLQAQTQLNKTNQGLATSLQRLSSGLRINGAKDDAAGLAIASRFTAQVRGYNQGTRNAADAISLSQTQDGALDEMASNVQRIRELAVQSANGTNTSSDRTAITAEVTKLEAEVTRIAGNTKFNDANVFGSAIKFQIGAGTADTVSTDSIAGTTLDVDVSTAAKSTSAIATADTTLATINATRAKVGATINQFESIIRTSENMANNLSDARGRIEDTDFAKETASLTKMQILQQAGISMLSQANSMPQSALSLLG